MSNGLWECPDCGEIVEQNKLHECQSVMSCPECGGSGRIEVHSEDEYIEACRKCGGSGVASVPPEPPTMSDERVVERALAFVREFKGDNRCSLNCLHSEALAQHVTALRAECARLTAELATAWCELGRVPDPRMSGLKFATVAEVHQMPEQTFSGTARPLTQAEAESVVRAARAAAPTPGETTP